MAVSKKLACFSVPAVAEHTATVVFIHGLGDTGHGWEPVTNMFKNDPDLDHIKWVFPHSPTRPVTANLGIDTPSWFDIYSFGFNVREDEEGMEASVSSIKNVIQDEIDSGIKSSRILLGGFSQGGAMSLLTSLTSNLNLAGVVCLSGWLPLRDKFNDLANQEAFLTPIFWCHGSADPLVKLEYSREGVDQLVKLGVPLAMSGILSGLSYSIYEGMGHTTNQKELDDLRVFIKSAVPRE